MNLYRKLAPCVVLLSLTVINGCSTTPDKKAENVLTALTAPPTPPFAPDSKRLNGIAALVNDDIITYREVQKEAEGALQDLERNGTKLGGKSRLELHQKVLNRLIDKQLTEQKTKELGIKIGDEEIRQAIDDVKRQNNNMTNAQLESALKAQGISMPLYEQQIREQLERLRLVSMEVRSKINVTDKDTLEFYQKNLANYAEDEQFKASHIFIRIDEKAPPEQAQKAMEKALKVLYEARQGKDFAALAREFSEDPAAAKDSGSLGTFKRGEMLPELEKALLPLKSGEVGELVATPSGLHIVRLDDRSQTRYKPFDNVKADIREQLYRKMQDERFQAWLSELRAKATIIIKDGTGIL